MHASAAGTPWLLHSGGYGHKLGAVIGKAFADRIRQAFTPRPETREVRWDETAFATYDAGELRARIPWSDVGEIFAFKEDRLTWDDICLGFRLRDKDVYYVVTEDFIGYAPFLEHLAQRFRPFRDAWFPEVARPAFAVNRATLWKGPAAGQGAAVMKTWAIREMPGG